MGVRWVRTAGRLGLTPRTTSAGRGGHLMDRCRALRAGRLVLAALLVGVGSMGVVLSTAVQADATSALTVTSVTVPADGTYVTGDNLDFAVSFSEAAIVTGVPRIPITLDTPGTVFADYLTGSGTDTLTFRFTVQAGDQDLTGIV